MAEQPSMKSYGVNGVRVSNGYVYDEFIVKLRGESGRRIFREMRDNEPVLSAIAFAIEMLFRAVRWKVVAQESTNKEPKRLQKARKEAAMLMENMLFKEMDHSWDDFISDLTSMFVFGWYVAEKIYNVRPDGVIAIKALAGRPQESLLKWIYSQEDPDKLVGMQQRLVTPNPSKLSDPVIPIGKCLLFRPHNNKNSPEGRSMLRSAYRPWYFKKHIEEIEATAIERELAGLPLIRLPKALLGSDLPQDMAIVQEYVRMGRDVKFNEQGCVVIPSDPFVDPEGKYSGVREVEFELVSSNGKRSIDTTKIVDRHELNMARTVLADFIMLGSKERGSFALSKSKTDMFLKAIEGWLETIAQTVDKGLIRDIWIYNGFPMETMPSLSFGRVAPEDLGELGKFIESLGKSSLLSLPDIRLENTLRDAAGLPETPPDAEQVAVNPEGEKKNAVQE